MKLHTRILITFVLVVASCGLGLAQQAELDLVKIAEDVAQEVSRLRELEIKSPIAKGLKSRDEIRSYLVDRIKEEYKPEEIELEGRVLKKLGLIPQDMNLYDFVLKLLTEQVAGYYDPKTKTFYIADWLDPNVQKPIMAHELTHALQDQHFDVKRFLKREKGNDDAMLARNAILEGDATAIMIDYMVQPMGMSFVNLPNIDQFMGMQTEATAKEYQIFASAPEYFKQTLMFPYISGLSFMHSYRKVHSWDTVAKVYGDLPKSTEQIMHPAKYMGIKDEPTTVEAEKPRALPPGNWKSIYTNVLGEFTTLLMLKQFVEESDAGMASRGWDGDLLQLFTNESGKEALAMRFVWDSETDAQQFFESYARLIGKKLPELVSEGSRPETTWKNPAGDVRVRLTLQGTQVDILEL